jgi:hypothetical protein
VRVCVCLGGGGVKILVGLDMKASQNSSASRAVSSSASCVK